MQYPKARTDDRAITAFTHGAEVSDPYQWLENLGSSEVKDFVNAQNALTISYLKSCEHLEDIRNALNEKNNFVRMSCPTQAVGKIFYFMSDSANRGRDSLYLQESVTAKPQVLVSPDAIPGKSKSVTYYLRMYSVSLNCSTIAYAYSTTKNGEWMSIRFKDIRTGHDYPEELKNVCKSDICWTQDNQGILYSCFPGHQQLHHKVVFHRPGTPQENDIVMVEFPANPAVTLQAQISDTGSMIFIHAQDNSLNPNASFNHFLYGDFTPSIHTDYEFTPLLYHLFEGDQLDIQYITNVYDDFTYFRTNIRAPNFRIVRCRLLHKEKLVRNFWETVVLEDPNRLLDWALCVNQNFLMLCYLENCVHSLQLHKVKDGTLIHKYSLPLGTIIDYSGSRNSSRFYFTLTSFLIPDRVQYIRVRVRSKEKLLGMCRMLRQQDSRRIENFSQINQDQEKALGLNNFVLKRLFCKNKNDGKSISMFVVHKKNIKMNGSTPCIIYGQGCFGVQVLPSFSIQKIIFLKKFGGMIAMVNIRGGGERGENSYHEGSGLRKQTTYDDFIAAAEFLIKSGYTSPQKLILEGEMFGGNLAGVCFTQRPDLFGAVIICDGYFRKGILIFRLGLLDMLRFNKFTQSKMWKTEFGDPENRRYFEKLVKISPLHNLPVEYAFVKGLPAVLVITTGKDSKHAHPSDSIKFIAHLQRIQSSTKAKQVFRILFQSMPVLLRVFPRSFGYDEVAYKIDERTEIFAFLMKALGLTFTK